MGKASLVLSCTFSIDENELAWGSILVWKQGSHGEACGPKHVHGDIAIPLPSAMR